jgi:hypothetical protein
MLILIFRYKKKLKRMKRINKFLFAICMAVGIFSSNIAQIQTTDLPEPGFEARIEDYINDIGLIDTHEHLITEEERIERAGQLDFTYLFSHYANEDLISASNLRGIINIVFSNDFPLEDRWELFQPFFKEMRNTAYARAVLLAANDIYGISDINDDTYVTLSEKIRENSKPGLYKTILKEKSGIDLSITDGGHRLYDTLYYRHVERFDQFILVSSKRDITGLGSTYDINVRSLDDYLKALRKAFKAGVDYHMVGVKSALAYQRILKFNNTSHARAQSVFETLFREEAVNKDELKALQDFMMHRVLDLAEEFDLPIQIHTGLQAGNGNDITHSDPTHLINLFMEHPGVNFCLFHSSYPYGGELSVLAKNFPNVFIDMCWTPVISPAYSIRYLDEWLETVPANKIMVFGGDYSVVEMVYAHSVFARRVVTRVLNEKVRTGYFSEEEAKYIALKILRENALEIFKIRGHSRGAEKIAALNRPGRLHDWWKIHNSSEGIMRDWMVIGPFPFADGLDQAHPPEAAIEFDRTYTGTNSSLSWQKVKTGQEGYVNFISIFSQDKAASGDMVGMAYAYTEIISPEDCDITLTLGSNDGAKIWLNHEVIYNVHIGRSAIADQVFLDVHLKKGSNKILAKVENLGASWGLYMRVVAGDNNISLKSFDSRL